MELKPGYKQTEVGVIPEEWDISQFGDLVNYTKGYAFKSSEYSDAGVRVIRVSDTTFDSIEDVKAVYISENSAKAYKKWQLREGDLVFSTVGSKPPMYDSLVGKAILIPKKYSDSLLNQNAVLIRAKEYTIDFQKLLLNHFRTERYIDFIELIFRGNANQASITLENLFQYKIPLPRTKTEQRAIATALSDVDALLDGLDQLIAKKRDLKQAAMQQLLTGETRLSGFEEDWPIKVLGKLFAFSGGHSASRDQLSSEGHCYLHYGDIHGTSKTHVDTHEDFQDIPKLNIPLSRISSKSLLKDGDVVFVDASEDTDGTSKHVVVVNEENIPFISGLHTIVAKRKTDELVPKYLRYCFQTAAIKQQFLFYSVGTKVTGISKTNIPKLTLPVPTGPEQTAIATVLSDMDAEIASLEQRRNKTRDLKRAMMQELLTGKTRLVTPGGSDVK